MVLLSYAHNEELHKMTADCVNSLAESEDPAKIAFNILVIESNKQLRGYNYPHTHTIYPDTAFGYHHYMNMGVDLTSSEYICLCNNDLRFHKGWATEIMKYMRQFPKLLSASPICSIIQPYMGIPLNSGPRVGYRVGFEIAGWCLFVRREIFKIIGRLDENFSFSGADFDYATTLAILDLKHALITSSIVDHLNSKTLAAQSKERQDELTSKMSYYSKKWGYRILP